MFLVRWENSILCILIYLHGFVHVTFIDALEGRCKRRGNYHAPLYYRVVFFKSRASWDNVLGYMRTTSEIFCWKWKIYFFYFYSWKYGALSSLILAQGALRKWKWLQWVFYRHENISFLKGQEEIWAKGKNQITINAKHIFFVVFFWNF